MNTVFKKSLTSIAVLSLGLASSLGFAQESKPANWYVNVDIAQFSQSELSKHINNEEGRNIDFLPTLLTPAVAAKSQSITIYGEGDTGQNLTAVVKGEYQGQLNAITSNLISLGLKKQDKTKHGVIFSGVLNKSELEKRFDSDEVEVELDGDKTDKPMPAYASVKDNRYIILSKSRSDVEAWLSGAQTWSDKQNGAMFEVVVDVQQALVHGGFNLDAVEDLQFQSISAKQIKQVSVRYAETNQIVDIEVALESHTVETANQVTAVVRGLMALQALASEDKNLTMLLSNLQVNQNGAFITLKLSATADAIRTALEGDSQDESHYRVEAE